MQPTTTTCDHCSEGIAQAVPGEQVIVGRAIVALGTPRVLHGQTGTPWRLAAAPADAGYLCDASPDALHHPTERP